MSDSIADPRAGGLVSRYRIVRKLGQGGMGEVYLAHDGVLDRHVALKFLLAGREADAMTGRRFLQEARLAAALDHPYICKIFETGLADGTYFIALEYIPGETLEDVMGRGPLGVAEALRIAVEIAEALEDAHRHRVVHCDLKPANIMLTTDRHVKVMDFGVATRFAAEGEDETRTSVSTAGAGTLPYMSPEQLRRQPPEPRSDLFSFGVVLYELITGVHPFRRSTGVDTTAAILNEPAPPLTGFSDTLPALPQLFARLIAKDPGERHESARALLADLRQLQRNLAAPPPTRGPAAPVGVVALPSIAVLPFADLSEQQDQAYFGEGLSEELINALSKLGGVRVTSRSSAFRFKGTALDAREVGQLLNVSHVLEGSVRTSGSRIRVHARLVDTADGAQRWTERFDREQPDVFAIQDEISTSIVRTLEVALGAGSRDRLTRRQTQDATAYQLYLKGRYYWNKRTGESIRKGIELLEQALVADPSYALAYAGLADAFVLLAMHGNLPATTVCPKAKRAAERAIELDPALGAAHASLGVMLAAYDRDWVGAEHEFRRALALSPGDASARALFGITCLSPQCRFEEALTEILRAVELDPLSLSINTVLGGILHEREEYERAVDQYRKTIELDPGFYFAHFNLGRALARLGRHHEALAAYERALALHPASVHVRSLIAKEYCAIGRRDEALAILAEVLEQARTSHVPAIAPAMIYIGLGDTDHALEWLGRSVAGREIWAIWTASSPTYKPYHDDPRYVDLLTQLGLPHPRDRRG